MRRNHLISRRGFASGMVALALLVASPARGQSLFSTGGLGLVADPIDARGSALGGTGLGLPGPELSWDNPAGAVGLPAAGLRVSFQMDDFEASFSNRNSTGATARFPLLIGAFPFGDRWAVTAGFAGMLDQNWSFEHRDTLVVDMDSIEVLDRFISEGGASRFRLGAAYRVLPSLSLGIGAELFTGGVRRATGRVFPSPGFNTGVSTASWTYSGAGLLASVDWNPSGAVSLSLAGSAGGSLDADSTSGAEAVDRSYDLPVMVNGGVSGRVASNLLVVLGGQWAGWSTLNDALVAQGGARNSWSAHAGIEAELLQVLGQPMPFRLGARTERLPFRFLGPQNDWADERGITGGTGVVLGGGAARLDFSLERGQRGSEAAGLEESYWRLLFSATVLGR